MTVSKTDKENLNAVISVQIKEEDYKDAVNKELNKYRRQAQIKGFRPGKAPMALIKRMAGPQILSQEVDKLVSMALSEFIVEEKLSLLGQPLPSEDQKTVDLENEDSYEFLFDIGLAPEINLEVNKDILIPYYNLKVSEEEVDKQAERYQHQFSSQEEKEKITKKSYVRGDIAQCKEDGTILEDGIAVEDTLIAIDIIRDEDEQKKFIGKEKDELVFFDIKKAYPNDSEIAGILSVDKDSIAEIDSHFQMIITEISESKTPELNEELFEKVFPKAEIKTEEDFKKKIKEELGAIYKDESGYRFAVDAREILLEKHPIALPDAFLKRWIMATNSDKELTQESLEKEYPFFAKNTAWQLLKGDIADKQELEISDEDFEQEAIKMTKLQLEQYGLPVSSLSEEQLKEFAASQLNNEEQKSRMAESIIQNKVLDYLKESVSLDEKEITLEDLKEIYNNDQKDDNNE